MDVKVDGFVQSAPLDLLQRMKIVAGPIDTPVQPKSEGPRRVMMNINLDDDHEGSQLWYLCDRTDEIALVGGRETKARTISFKLYSVTRRGVVFILKLFES